MSIRWAGRDDDLRSQGPQTALEHLRHIGPLPPTPTYDTCKKIPADDWAQVVLGLAEPTVEMIATVCENRPHFTEWVVLGRAGNLQVNPASEASVAAWSARKQADWVEFEKAFRATKKHGNKKG